MREARRAQAKTGLFPGNPRVGFGHFPAEEKGHGVKRTWGVSQSFDFPTVYFQKVKIASATTAIAEAEYAMRRQELLLEAKLLLIEYAFAERYLGLIRKRFDQTQNLVAWVAKKVEAGEASALELSNAHTRMLAVGDQLQIGLTGRDIVRQQLLLYNNGLEIKNLDTVIVSSGIVSLDSVILLSRTMDPRFRLLQLSIDQSKHEVALTRQQWLPEMEVGYESEKTDAETFRGVRMGISIPLWARTGAVSAAKAYQREREANASWVESELVSEIQQDYLRMTSLQARINDYDRRMASINSLPLLAKALQLGSTSVIQFINEVEFLYDLYGKRLDLERELAVTVAKLERFKL